ncbi:NAD-dependent 4,6-dehydratase LegB [Candidatus Dependentiae bacterium]|nr:NAD-dependent 4,6-dehydratase LegB [Candidatus Dependentiae bacterium]
MKNCKVLVTGAAGFIGSHLSELLVERGYKVKAFVRYNSKNDWGWLEYSKYKDEMEIFVGDLRDYDAVKNAVKNTDIIFHLGALIGIPYSYYSPDAYLEVNIKGTLNILNAARDLNLKKIVHTSTSEIYGTAQFVPITELHPINPQSPYAATKSAADFLALSFYRSFDLPVAIIRPFNTYGPRQSSRAIIPTVITQILSGGKKISLGSLTPTRDLTFVKDTAEAFLKIAESENTVGEIINAGSKFEISINDLVKKISMLIGEEIIVEQTEERKRPEKSEVERLFADNSKIKNITGWVPKYSLDSGLTETIEWMKLNLKNYKSGIYNV